MSVHTSTHVAVACCRAWKTTLWMPLPASLAFTVMPTTPFAFGGGKLSSSDVGSTWSTPRAHGDRRFVPRRVRRRRTQLVGAVRQAARVPGARARAARAGADGHPGEVAGAPVGERHAAGRDAASAGIARSHREVDRAGHAGGRRERQGGRGVVDPPIRTEVDALVAGGVAGDGTDLAQAIVATEFQSQAYGALVSVQAEVHGPPAPSACSKRTSLIPRAELAVALRATTPLRRGARVVERHGDRVEVRRRRERARGAGRRRDERRLDGCAPSGTSASAPSTSRRRITPGSPRPRRPTRATGRRGP